MLKTCVLAAYTVVIGYAFVTGYLADSFIDTLRAQMVGCAVLICVHLYLIMQTIGEATDGKRKKKGR